MKFFSWRDGCALGKVSSYGDGVVAVFLSKNFQSPDLAFREYRTYDRVPSRDCLMQWLNLLSLSTVANNHYRFQKKKKLSLRSMLYSTRSLSQLDLSGV